MTAAFNDDDLDELLNSELMQRRFKVMFLRNGGVTWAAVAKEVGVSELTARKDYAAICRDLTSEDPSHIIARHRAVIYDIQRANYPAMMQGDKDAAASILRALEREAKLLGLDSPTKILAAVSGEDFANQAARLITRIQELDADTLKELTRGGAEQQVIDAEVVEPDGDRSQGGPGPAAQAAPAVPDGTGDGDQPAPGNGARPGAGRRKAPAARRAAGSGGRRRAPTAKPAEPDRRDGDRDDAGRRDDAAEPGGDDDWSNI